jgi:glutamate-1-semialdehyde 2,1-aminomutase
MEAMTHLVGGISSTARAVPDLEGKAFAVARSRGAWLWDEQGRCYADTAMGFGATMLGHAHPAVVEAVQAAVARGGMPAFAHRMEEEAAAALAARTGELSRVVFVNTGSEAVHLACRIARASTGRRRIAKFGAGYDGWYEEVAFGNAGSREALMEVNARPMRGDTALLRFNDIVDAEMLFAEDNIAAVVIEPILANAGCLLPDPGYLARLSAIAHAHGAMVILDEVLMGFRLCAGLSGTMLAVRPDLATVGKAIGSGFAVAAVLGTEAAMAGPLSGQVNLAGTYNGNPVACAAVCATMRELDSVDYTALLQAGDSLRQMTEQAFADVGAAVCSTGYGTVFTLWPGEQAPRSYTQAANQLDQRFTLAMHKALRRRGVMSMPMAYGRHYLSAAHDEEAMDVIQLAFRGMARDLLLADEP